MKRQNIRKLVLISSMLLFPITIYYFLPQLIISGAMVGIIECILCGTCVDNCPKKAITYKVKRF